MLRGTAIVLFAGGWLYAQPADSKPAFDVASIKRSSPTALVTKWRGGPGTDDPSRVTIENYLLQSLIAEAYGVEYDQVTGPEPLDAHYDVNAKVPDGATKKQAALMMQNLLAERFHLTIHREKQEGSVNDLVVAKNGSKLKESPKNPPPDDPNPPSDFGKPGPDGYPLLGSGRGYRMAVNRDHAAAQFTGATIAQLANLLTGQMHHPVTDATGLTGKYDFRLRWVPEGFTKPGDDPQPTLAGAIQQLGLRLEQKKGFVDMIVVDHVDKVPTEN